MSCGFYCLPVSAYECPGHPKSPEEIQNEDRRQQDKYKPHPDDNEQQRKGRQRNQGDNVSMQ